VRETLVFLSVPGAAGYSSRSNLVLCYHHTHSSRTRSVTSIGGPRTWVRRRVARPHARIRIPPWDLLGTTFISHPMVYAVTIPRHMPYIIGGSMLLQEVLREAKFKKQHDVVLKIDWKSLWQCKLGVFLFHCCGHKGFSEMWLIWIKAADTNFLWKICKVQNMKFTI
jgi:hypothetical protein